MPIYNDFFNIVITFLIAFKHDFILSYTIFSKSKIKYKHPIAISY
jgi:hypothetical protein